VKFPQGGCSRTLGVGARLDPAAGDHDGYEPHEPALERDGPAWFYFIPSVDKVDPGFHVR
jgi:hypothetical protein